MGTPFPNQATLLVVDVQRAFAALDGSVSRQGRQVDSCQAAVATCAKLVNVWRSCRRPVIWTQMGFGPGYRDGGLLTHEIRPGIAASGGLRWGTDDVRLMLEPTEDEPVLRKARFSAFIGTELEALLRSFDARDLVVAGLTTSMCVESTVRDAAQRDIRVFVAEDAVADYEPETHRASLERIAYGFGYVMKAAQLLDESTKGGNDS